MRGGPVLWTKRIWRISVKYSIIHGKGTGVLRAACSDFLRRHRHVKSFRLGAYGEGGTGVTVAELQ